MNYLYYGDNLEVMRLHMKDESVDLVYLDPPFKSDANYNVLFHEQDGSKPASQVIAFEDTWHWDQSAARAFEETVEQGGKVADVMRAFRTFLGTNDMLAYLSMMAPRLTEIRRIMKPTASIYLHCDPTSSHYLKLLMDAVFDPRNFKTEIIWKRTSAHNDGAQGRKQHGRIHDVILFYAKSNEWVWNQVYTKYDEDYIDTFYKFTEEHTGRKFTVGDITGPGGAAKGNPRYEVMGVTRYWRYSRDEMQRLISEGRIIQTKPGTVPRYKRYLDEMRGVPLQDIWTDINPISSQAAERLGYPTQKPIALLERIVSSSSNVSDVVFDPFCGCGTTIDAAQKLGRQWIGIDITHLAIGLIRHRLYGTGVPVNSYKVIGEPIDMSGARELARSDPYQFQWWALGLLGARPTEQKKGSDKGIDGRLLFHDERGGETKQVIFSVKAGKIQSSYVRDLIGVLDREKAQIGVLISLNLPTADMKVEAASAGFYHSPFNSSHPRVQLLTVEEVMNGRGIDLPIYTSNRTLKSAAGIRRSTSRKPAPQAQLQRVADSTDDLFSDGESE